MKDKLMKLFYDYLHTVTLYHDDMPNEPFKQVIFKSEISELVDQILILIKSNMPKKKDIPMIYQKANVNDIDLETKITLRELQSYEAEAYNQHYDDCLKAMGSINQV